MGIDLIVDDTREEKSLQFNCADGFWQCSEEDLILDRALYSYHTSWDTLMPVIQEIENHAHNYNENLIGEITMALNDYDLENTYIAVITFIKATH